MKGGDALVVMIPPPAFKIEHTRSDLEWAARPRARKYRGPIIDTHMHLPHRKYYGALEDIMQGLDDAGVEMAIFMPAPGSRHGRRQYSRAVDVLSLKELGGDRIELFCGSDYITQ